jgi:hypothetical protein
LLQYLGQQRSCCLSVAFFEQLHCLNQDVFGGLIHKWSSLAVKHHRDSIPLDVLYKECSQTAIETRVVLILVHYRANLKFIAGYPRRKFIASEMRLNRNHLDIIEVVGGGGDYIKYSTVYYYN